MKFLVCATDIPYPPHRGGRADVWRRILALTSLGHTVFLVHLYEPLGAAAPLPEHWKAMDAVLAGRCSMPMRRSAWRTFKRLAASPWLPWHAATRVPEPDQWPDLTTAVDRFAPDAVWLDGPWFGEAACFFARRLRVPLLYRSHNVEHRYILGQARIAHSLRNRLAWTLACLGLERYELALLRKADAVFDISMDDMREWQSRGVINCHWLPPLPELALSGRVDQPIPSDLVFSGNLKTPNNVAGLRWFIDAVLPRVRDACPGVRMAVVGSAPEPALLAYLRAQPGVDVHVDVDSVTPYLFGARVLVNPVSVGSGVQLKMLDMLMTDAPIVTRSQGTRGLPQEVRRLVSVADEAAEFAAAVVQGLQAPSVDVVARKDFRSVFTAAGLVQLVTGEVARLRGSIR